MTDVDVPQAVDEPLVMLVENITPIAAHTLRIGWRCCISPGCSIGCQKAESCVPVGLAPVCLPVRESLCAAQCAMQTDLVSVKPSIAYLPNSRPMPDCL